VELAVTLLCRTTPAGFACIESQSYSVTKGCGRHVLPRLAPISTATASFGRSTGPRPSDEPEKTGRGRCGNLSRTQRRDTNLSCEVHRLPAARDPVGRRSPGPSASELAAADRVRRRPRLRPGSPRPVGWSTGWGERQLRSRDAVPATSGYTGWQSYGASTRRRRGEGRKARNRRARAPGSGDANPHPGGVVEGRPPGRILRRTVRWSVAW
jgi:hypothetical protein